VKASPLCWTLSASYCCSAAGLEIEKEVSPNAPGKAPLALFSLMTAVVGSGAVQLL
jgi:hypothetical protein